jgi:hypothetical protein
MNLRKYFAQMWPGESGRRIVLEQYRIIANQKLALADIALRGGVYSVDPRPPANFYDAGVREGRRQMALEIARICDADPAHLYGFVERKPQNQEPNR